VAAAAAGRDIYLTREDYLYLTRNNWRDIWFWPAIMSLVVFAIFTLGMPKKSEQGAATPQETTPEPGQASDASTVTEESGEPSETPPPLPSQGGNTGDMPPDEPFNSP